MLITKQFNRFRAHRRLAPPPPPRTWPAGRPHHTIHSPSTRPKSRSAQAYLEQDEDPTRTSEIRNRWLDYFAANEYEIWPSVPLASPEPPILLTVAGMVPFIPYILGTEETPWLRVASVQKCIRTNDIDNAGITTRHGTLFQMNGNFPSDDYFKEGAISYAWGLLTDSREEGGYSLGGDWLWMMIWEEDQASLDYWAHEIGVPVERIQLLPLKDISWLMDQPGPAGFCCEIHYDRGPAYGPDGGPVVDTQGDRFLGIQNPVFDEFLRGEGKGHDFKLLGKLDQTTIDTGAGLERPAFIAQDKPNMHEIDEVFPVTKAAEELSGKAYGHGSAGPEAGKAYHDDVRMRVVADHVCSALMLICDGMRPGDGGRGYVLRRLVRRAVRSMRLLDVDEAAIPTLLTISRDTMKSSYSELGTGWSTISEAACGEEDVFRRTLAAGTTILDTAVASAKKEAGRSGRLLVSGKSAFELHDTYGFLIDLTFEMAVEQEVDVDESVFRSLMNEQKERARADARAKKTGHADIRVFRELEKEMGGGSTFLSYTESFADATVTGALVDGAPQSAVTAPAEAEVVLDWAPFWAEMGGQLADQGTIRLADGDTVEVDDVQVLVKGLYVYRGTLTEGTIAVGKKTFAQVDSTRRLAIACAHTSTHMVYKALHEIVSDNTAQAGSESSSSHMHFDFCHGSAPAPDQISGIEEWVNNRLSEDLAVTDEVMDIDAARTVGAMALLGEKYGKQVRVVFIGGDWSKELCAGTYVPSTGYIGRIVVLGESPIGLGVRHIDALVGGDAYGYQTKEHALVSQLSTMVGGRPEDLPERVENLMTRLGDAEKCLAAAGQAALLARTAGIVSDAVRLGEVYLASADLGTVGSADAIRPLVLDTRSRLGDAEPAVVVVGAVAGSCPVVVVTTNAGVRDQGTRAGAPVRTAAQVLGDGDGGKDDLAQGGGQNPQAPDEVLRVVAEQIQARSGKPDRPTRIADPVIGSSI